MQLFDLISNIVQNIDLNIDINITFPVPMLISKSLLDTKKTKNKKKKDTH